MALVQLNKALLKLTIGQGLISKELEQQDTAAHATIIMCVNQE
jgi:hypothetical protein